MLFAIVASLMVLPCVLANCCLPDQYEAIAFNSDNPNVAYNVVRDFTKRSMMIKVLNPEHTLNFYYEDYKLGASYVMYKDGSCQKYNLEQELSQLATLMQCTSAGNSTGSWVFGEGTDVNSYSYEIGHYERHMVVSKDKCYPMLYMNHDNDFKYTIALANIKVGADVNTALLSPDVSTCA